MIGEQQVDENLELDDSDYAAIISKLIVRARTDFLTYLYLLNPPGASPFIWSRLHEYLSERVQKVADKVIKPRQIISVPPQCGKSTVLSKEAASWILGRFPTKQLAITSYSSELVTDFSKDIRARIQEPLYRKIFPEVEIREGDNTQDTWRLTAGGSLRARSTGSKLTGRRVDYLIVDDPHAGREEAESPLLRKRVIDWYWADCYTRLAPDAAVFLIMTRWHPQDLVGHLIDENRVKELEASAMAASEGKSKEHKEIFEVTNISAISEKDKDADPLGREPGESCFPEVRDIQFFTSIKESIPEYEWRSQYQGNPRASSSNQADTSLIKKIDISLVPEGIEKVRSWDLAISEKQAGDYTAGALTAYNILTGNFYLIDMLRNKKTWVKNKKDVLYTQTQDCEEWNSHRMSMEAVAGFGAVVQDLRQLLLGECKVEPRFPPKGGKLARALPWLNKIESGNFYMVIGPWNKDFIAELETFPAGDHDDQIDAISCGWETHTGANRTGVNQQNGSKRPTSARRPTGAHRPRVNRS